MEGLQVEKKRELEILEERKVRERAEE